MRPGQALRGAEDLGGEALGLNAVMNAGRAGTIRS